MIYNIFDTYYFNGIFNVQKAAILINLVSSSKFIPHRTKMAIYYSQLGGTLQIKYYEDFMIQYLSCGLNLNHE